MTPEKLCAEALGAREGEEFLAVGEKVAIRLNPRYHEDLREGRMTSLPDLLSVKQEAGAARFRLREVKFKLEDAIVRKAIAQLASGARYLGKTMPEAAASLDRLEIVVALGARELKPPERAFLGKPVEPGRYRLRLGGAAASVRVRGKRHPVTVVIL